MEHFIFGLQHGRWKHTGDGTGASSHAPIEPTGNALSNGRDRRFPDGRMTRCCTKARDPMFRRYRCASSCTSHAPRCFDVPSCRAIITRLISRPNRQLGRSRAAGASTGAGLGCGQNRSPSLARRIESKNAQDRSHQEPVKHLLRRFRAKPSTICFPGTVIRAYALLDILRIGTMTCRCIPRVDPPALQRGVVAFAGIDPS